LRTRVTHSQRMHRHHKGRLHGQSATSAGSRARPFARPTGSTVRGMRTEPVMVVERRKELTYLLCQAAELEHGLMCQYLYAAFSLRGEPGPGLADDQLAAAERWRRVILAVSGEEMLHWAVVQNLLIAVGSAPYVSRPHLPHQARGYPPGIQLR